MSLFLYSIILLISFYLLAKICDDYFVESLDVIAHRLKMSSDAAGATLMAIGSSAPELFVAIISVLKEGDHEQIGMGNIIGSAVFNLLIITGLLGIMRQFKLVWHILLRDLLFYLISVIFLYNVFLDGNILWYEAISFIVLYAIYVLLVIKWKNIITFTPEIKEIPALKKVKFHINFKKMVYPLDFLLDKIFGISKNMYFLFFGSIGMIGFLSWILVESAIGISSILNISEAFIALTVLAIGTSVPDLLSSIIVGRQNRSGMAVTNAIGSNIFDILIGLGIPFLILHFINGKSVSINTTELIGSTGILILSILLILILVILNKWVIGKKMGLSLIIFYIAFLVYEFFQA